LFVMILKFDKGWFCGDEDEMDEEGRRRRIGGG
jgi:hypothetical protein